MILLEEREQERFRVQRPPLGSDATHHFDDPETLPLVRLGVEIQRDLGLDRQNRDDAARRARRDPLRRADIERRFLIQDCALELA